MTRRKWGYELRGAIRELAESAPVKTIFAEDVLESSPAREAFIFLSILADPNDPVALRDWVAYQEDDEGKAFKGAPRNAEAYLNLKQRIGALTVGKLIELRGEPVTNFRGNGRGLLDDRIQRLLGLLDVFDLDRPPTEIVMTSSTPSIGSTTWAQQPTWLAMTWDVCEPRA